MTDKQKAEMQKAIADFQKKIEENSKPIDHDIQKVFNNEYFNML